MLIVYIFINFEFRNVINFDVWIMRLKYLFAAQHLFYFFLFQIGILIADTEITILYGINLSILINTHQIGHHKIVLICALELKCVQSLKGKIMILL